MSHVPLPGAPITKPPVHRRRSVASRPWLAALLVAVAACFLSISAVFAHEGVDHTPPTEPTSPEVLAAGVHAACAGGPSLPGGTVLDECITRSFMVGGINKTVRVWYTKIAVAVDYTEDSVDYSLEHWITTDAQAQQVAAWFEDAWQRFFTDSGHHLYDTGCADTLNVRMEDGIGWSGIAYWGSSGNCWIGIDSPDVRAGGGQFTVYHEAQHYLQYSYDDGCYGFLKPNYPSDSEFVEGYADLGADSVTTTVDAMAYGGITYDPTTSMYDKSYGNIFNKYFIEQLGSYATPADPWHNIDALYTHYTMCDGADSLYVLNSVIPALNPTMSERKFFLNFFAANWAKDWADPVTQPELVYLDDDGNPYGSLVVLTQNINMAGGTQAFAGTTPDDWAANYYQVTPQAGCPYIQMDVNGEPGAQLGINLMTAKTTAPTKVVRSGYIGEDFTRTFAAAGQVNRVVAAINSFNSNFSYDVTFTCVNPIVNLLEPKQTNYVLVGEPATPIAFMARWEVLDGADNVRGLPQSAFTFDAEGAAATVVTGTFQEVGNEYWAVLLPPVKPAGTTFVDFKVTLTGADDDTELNALLYVDPGNSDIAISFDASGSMSTEDTIGEGTRLQLAKRAGQVIADLLRAGDRIVVQDWSANDVPGGCGLPGGDGNCPLDVRTLLPLSDATLANLSTLIGLARTQINNITAREWTPVAGGIQAAIDALLAGAANTNPKYVFLLSDGEENVNPLYATERTDIINSGVVVNTIGFGPEAPGNLLAQIATDTGGDYRPVATGPSGAGLMAAEADGATAMSELAAMDAPAEVAATLAAPFLPGHLGLANVYDYFDTVAQDASRIIHMPYTGVGDSEFREFGVHIDPSVTQLRLVVVGKYAESHCGYERQVDVLPPDDNTRKRWVPISPLNPLQVPAGHVWEVINNTFDDVLIVTKPVVGEWRFRTRYFQTICVAGAENLDAEGQVVPPAVQSAEAAGLGFDFIMNVSVQSAIQLQGFLQGLTANQGESGDVVTILGTLLNQEGTLPATLMLAQVQGPTGSFLLLMKDDGLHQDGEAGDNIYGALFGQTAYGGGYDVRIIAGVKDPADPGKTMLREWGGGFWLKGPKIDPGTGGVNCGGENDADNDCLPDDWERRCKLDLQRDDRRDDNDKDGLTNAQELVYGTLPCRADTDNGGENDGSEVNHSRNPLDPTDDKVRILDYIRVRPLNGIIRLSWSYAFSYTNMLLYVTTDPNQPGQAENMGQKGEFEVGGLQNGETYYVILQGVNGDAVGDYSDPIPVMPKADPDAPSGAMLIDNGKPVSTDKEVTLHLSSSDRPLEGAAQGANAHQTDMLSILHNLVSGNVEMRISNHSSMIGAAWEPLAATKPWTISCADGQTCTVYAQFRDAAHNESNIIYDTIEYDAPDNVVGTPYVIFLPIAGE